LFKGGSPYYTVLFWLKELNQAERDGDGDQVEEKEEKKRSH
jgi:hypothetical protein